MSQYNPIEEYSDHLLSQQQHAEETIRELSFKVKAYEDILSEAMVAKVNEEFRMEQSRRARPPLVSN